MFEGPVISSFRRLRETAGGKFPALKMIAEAVTANSLAATGFIAAITL